MQYLYVHTCLREIDKERERETAERGEGEGGGGGGGREPHVKSPTKQEENGELTKCRSVISFTCFQTHQYVTLCCLGGFAGESCTCHGPAVGSAHARCRSWFAWKRLWPSTAGYREPVRKEKHTCSGNSNMGHQESDKCKKTSTQFIWLHPFARAPMH